MNLYVLISSFLRLVQSSDVHFVSFPIEIRNCGMLEGVGGSSAGKWSLKDGMLPITTPLVYSRVRT